LFFNSPFVFHFDAHIVAIFEIFNLLRDMRFCGNLSVHICSILFFIGSIVAFSFQSNAVYLIGLSGLSIHAYCAIKIYLRKKDPNPEPLDHPHELGLDEKVKIMDDLDREAQRRREIEHFTRN